MVLRINGLVMVQEGDIYRIVKTADAFKQPMPAPGERRAIFPPTIKIMVNLVFLKYMTVTELATILEKFTGENAQTLTYAPANLLFIMDNRRNMKRTMDLIALFDSDTFANERVRLYELKNARPSDMQKDLEERAQEHLARCQGFHRALPAGGPHQHAGSQSLPIRARVRHHPKPGSRNLT